MGLEHGIDERSRWKGMAKMVKFYAQLMQVWGTKEMDHITFTISILDSKKEIIQ